MKRTHRKLLILVLLLALGAGAWALGLDRAADCWTKGGSWLWDGGFCRLDTMPQRPAET